MPFWTDGIAKAAKSLRMDEHFVLKGVVFKTELLFQLAIGATKTLCFTTATTKDVIWSTDLIISDKSNVHYKLYEGTTFTGTVSQPIINVNRQSPIVNESVGFNAVTGYSKAAAIEIDAISLLGGETVGQGQLGSTQPGGKFLILKRNTNYTIEILNSSGAIANIFVKSVFAEEVIGE